MAGTLDDCGARIPAVEVDEGFKRAEVDTTAPFGSVKEAVNRFGGLGFWKPGIGQNKTFEAQPCDADIGKLEQQAMELEKELVSKENDTLTVLKELESTKSILERLKSKLLQRQQGSATAATPGINANSADGMEEAKRAEEGDLSSRVKHQKLVGNLSPHPSSAPDLVLLELKQAKLNLVRTTNDLAEIRASVESYNKKIEKERISLEKARQRLSLNSSRVASLEQKLEMTRSKLKFSRENEGGDVDDSDGDLRSNFKDISTVLQRLNSEAEKFKKMGEAAKSAVVKAMSEIEMTKTRIKTAEIRLVAAKKMKEASRATEVFALAEINALEKSGNASEQNHPGVTLGYEEYFSLTSKARDALEERAETRLADSMSQVDGVNLSKDDVLRRIEEVTEQVQTSKKALEEALGRVEAANMAKLAVEEALRKWRSEHGHKRRSVHCSRKFKNSCASRHCRRDSGMLDADRINLIGHTSPVPVLKPTLSIGQILSQKLLVSQEFERGKKSNGKRIVSLGQMLGKENGYLASSWSLERQSGGTDKLSSKRKKFGFARFSLLLAKQNKKKNKSLLTQVTIAR